VRGSIQFPGQACQDALQILKHVVIPKARYAKFILREPIVAFDISNGFSVLTAIDLDD
jgi:hypothetical protein